MAAAICLHPLASVLFTHESSDDVMPYAMSYYWLSLRSKLEEIPRLRHCIATIARIEGYSDVFIADFELSVHEAFVNALIHGNRGNASLPVTMTLEAGVAGDERFLEVSIRDCGEGFEPVRALRSICSGWSEKASGGRGLFLVSQFAESFRIEKVVGGCVVVLRYIPY